MRVISSSEVCNRGVVVGGTSAAHLLAEMLQVPEDIQEAGTWNAAVQREVRSLTGANMPKCVTRAAFVGTECGPNRCCCWSGVTNGFLCCFNKQ